MKFGPVPVSEAKGAILAHSEQAKGASLYKIAKGTELTATHLTDLTANGREQVVVAELEAGDIAEDIAAQRLAAALVQGTEGLELGPATRGRVNLLAATPGVVEIDVAQVTAANLVDPGLTIATVPPWQRMAAGGLVATVKVIPYAVAETLLDDACSAALGAMGLRPAAFSSASLIETRVPGQKITDKGRRATADRLSAFDVRLTPRVMVDHQVDAIADAIAAAPGEVVLILTGSATSDARDTAPAALRHAGGAVTHYGMPVDPGNLLFVGTFAGKPVIGLPGCARSPALNGADWVLERMVCGVPVGAAEIMAMGVGGLLKESPARPHPRQRSS